jgi:hypothetical protein
VVLIVEVEVVEEMKMDQLGYDGENDEDEDEVKDSESVVVSDHEELDAK